ncbi:MAG TPA: hypothetical protein VNZ53_41480 [Steroidobacteraceae bacterium]|nr:hypothetical protein [Steroidobacteraceae bacterium]
MPRLFYAFNDPNISHGSVAERLKCFLIGRAFVHCNCLPKARKFDNQNPLLYAALIGSPPALERLFIASTHMAENEAS